VYDCIDRTVGIRSRDVMLDVCRHRDIRSDRGCPASGTAVDLFCGAFGGAKVRVHHEDVRAFRSEQAGAGPADVPASARDDRVHVGRDQITNGPRLLDAVGRPRATIRAR
jgi:hypothetical protein